jgi:hypothetical protein
VSDPVHVEIAAMLRKQFQQPRAVVAGEESLARDLADYDRAFGLIQGAAAGEEVN